MRSNQNRNYRVDDHENIGINEYRSNPTQPKVEDAESRPKIGRRGQPLQAREPMPGAEDAESRPKIGRRGQPLQAREPLPGAEDIVSRPVNFADHDLRMPDLWRDCWLREF